MFEFNLVLVISFVVSTAGAPFTTPQPLEPTPTLVVNASHAPVDWTKHEVWKFQSSNGKPAIIPHTKPTVANLGEEILEFIKEEDDLEAKLSQKAGTLKQHSLAFEEAPADTLLLVPQYRAVTSEPESKFFIEVTTEVPTTLDYNTRGPFRYDDDIVVPTSIPSSTFVPVVALNEAQPKLASTTPQVEYVSVVVETTPSFKRQKSVPITTTFVPAVALLEKERVGANLLKDNLSFATVRNTETTTSSQDTTTFVPVVGLKEIKPIESNREDSRHTQLASFDQESRSDSNGSFKSNYETTTLKAAKPLVEKERTTNNDALPGTSVPSPETTTPQVTSTFEPIVALEDSEVATTTDVPQQSSTFVPVVALKESEVPTTTTVAPSSSTFVPVVALKESTTDNPLTKPQTEKIQDKPASTERSIPRKSRLRTSQPAPINQEFKTNSNGAFKFGYEIKMHDDLPSVSNPEPAVAQRHREPAIFHARSQTNENHDQPASTERPNPRKERVYSQSAPIEQEFRSDSDGSFNFGYETGEGTKVKSNAYYKKAIVPQFDNRGRKLGDEEMDVLVQEGSYSYILPDGHMVVVQYIADEKGYRITNQSISK